MRRTHQELGLGRAQLLLKGRAVFLHHHARRLRASPCHEKLVVALLESRGSGGCWQMQLVPDPPISPTAPFPTPPPRTLTDTERKNALVLAEARRVKLEVLCGWVGAMMRPSFSQKKKNEKTEERQRKKKRTGASLPTILMVNFLSLKEMLRISAHGKPRRGVTLRAWVLPGG